MKKQFLFLSVCLLMINLSSTAQGVTTSEAVELINNRAINWEFPVVSDRLQLDQVGNNNQLTAIQQLDDNTSYILTAKQEGNENKGYIKQEGKGHESVLLQNGYSNEASLWSLGSNTQNFVQQKGNGNSINSLIENYNFNARATTSIQVGNVNRIDLQMNDAHADNNLLGLLVIQKGSGNSALLSLDNIQSPYLKVEQKGSGAAVSITQSAFNFPMK